MPHPTKNDRTTAIEGGILDRFISGVAPSWGFERQRARAKSWALGAATERVRRYEAATVGRRTAGWIRPGSSANVEIGPALHRLRAGSRDLRRNNQWADKAIRTRADDVIGTGYRPGALSLDMGTKEEERVMAIWRDWAEETAVDPGGTKTLYKIQNLAMQAMDESGEVLIRMRPRRMGDNLPIPLQLQILEPDHIDTLRDGVLLENGHRLIQGKEYDRLDRLVAFYLYPEHPGEMYSSLSLTSQRVPAGQVLHLYDELRPGQVRGIPRGTPCLLRTRDFDDFEDAVLMRQKLANLYVGFIHDIDGQAETDGTFTEDGIDNMEPGTYEHLPPGRTVTFAQPPHSQGYSDYAKISLRAIAAGYGTTYERLTGDLTQVNFSSGRMGNLQYQRSNESLLELTIRPILCARIWNWFRAVGVASGAFADANIRATWTPDGADMIDPAKEGKAQTEAILSGAQTLSGVARSKGRTRDELLDELVADKEAVDSRGLVLSCFPPPAPPKPEEPEEDPDENSEDADDDQGDDDQDENAEKGPDSEKDEK